MLYRPAALDLPRFSEVIGFVNLATHVVSYDLGTPEIELRQGPSVWGVRSWRDVGCWFGPNARRTSVGSAYKYHPSSEPVRQ